MVFDETAEVQQLPNAEESERGSRLGLKPNARCQERHSLTDR